MPNWENPGNDFPSREDIVRMERDNIKREKQYRVKQDKIIKYLESHPSASYAEAEYKTSSHISRQW